MKYEDGDARADKRLHAFLISFQPDKISPGL